MRVMLEVCHYRTCCGNPSWCRRDLSEECPLAAPWITGTRPVMTIVRLVQRLLYRTSGARNKQPIAKKIIAVNTRKLK